MADPIIWLAGPIGYDATVDYLDDGQRPISRCRWEFVGVSASGALRRWKLTFTVETRAFSITPRDVTQWERTHAEAVAALYRPIAVLRSALPKGGLVNACKAMLREVDIVEVTALAMRGGIPLMASIKAIYGPHRTEERGYCTTWHFTGVRASGVLCAWRLTFFYDSRQFRTKAIKSKPSRNGERVQENLHLLPEINRAETKEGLVTPMLRARLKPEHIARATYLAMQHGRK